MSAVIGAEPLRAGIEDFLPLLVFFFIWWVSSRRASNRRPPLGGQSSRQSPHRQESNSAEEISPGDVLRQMLFGGMEMPPMPPLQEPQDEAAFPSPFGEPYQTIRSENNNQPLASSLAERVLATPPQQEEVQMPTMSHASPPQAILPKPLRPAFTLDKHTLFELQRAIIWSEILATPLSLRDEER